MPKRSYNQSLLRAAGCPKLFLHRAGQGRSGSQSLLANLGTTLHGFAKQYQTHCLDHKVQSDITAARTIAAGLLAGSGLDAPNFEELLMLAQKFAEQEIIDRPDPVFEHTVSNGRFFGTPDKVAILEKHDPPKDSSARSVVKVLEIVDYKSGWKLPTHDECRADIQLPFYAGIYLNTFVDAEFFRLSYRYLRFGKDRTFEMSAGQIRAFMQDMEVLASRLDGVVEPTPVAGQLCDYCEIATDCELIVRGEVRALVDQEQAVKAAHFLSALRGARRELEARLRAWVEQNGPITMPDGSVLGYHAVCKSNFDPLEVFAWAARNTKLGAEKIMAHFKISFEGAKALAQDAKLDKAKKKELLDLRWFGGGSQFGFKKGGARGNQTGASQGLPGPQEGGCGPKRLPGPHLPGAERQRQELF